MDTKEFIQIVKKMFSKGLTPVEKTKLADEEIWSNITDVR